MKVLGITGGVGAGKSEVLEYLRTAYDAQICQLDQVAKGLQKKGRRCHKMIVDRFGEEILRPDGELDRAKLAEIVFCDPEKLSALNEIVHPAVKAWVTEEVAARRDAGTGLYVIEAALLTSAGYDHICDEIWYIYAGEAIRRKRLKSARGYTDEKITEMIQSQPSETDFRKACTAVIDNSGTFEATMRQIGEILV